MKNMVMFTAKDFARVISAGRKFMDKKKGTSFAAEICNQFIIEVIEEKEKNRIRAYLWASDGYRAARVEIPGLTLREAPSWPPSTTQSSPPLRAPM